MSDYYSIQQVGGTELAERYPDRGLIADAKWHNVVLTAGTKAVGWRRLFRKSERFLAVLSANTHGLRVLVSLHNFAVFKTEKATFTIFAARKDECPLSFRPFFLFPLSFLADALADAGCADARLVSLL